MFYVLFYLIYSNSLMCTIRKHPVTLRNWIASVTISSSKVWYPIRTRYLLPIRKIHPTQLQLRNSAQPATADSRARGAASSCGTQPPRRAALSRLCGQARCAETPRQGPPAG
ncbi:unnamed protein product [Nesidiocoris tenuis]|uniref:Uncharacterized protein n=1 Tax=Nesidiocoris tenuis TaxID=355587 RepID=A0A6H5H8X3_9HEMI|nr:unnamed protein product [Nesidiocoris tenuis]